jgi:RecA/RadA recombinase
MSIHKSVWHLIHQGFSDKHIISISGPAGSGKTSLALYLVGTFLTLKKPHQGSCIWIQASEAFPKKRLESLFTLQPTKLAYLNDVFYIIPREHACKTFSEQLTIFQKLIDSNFIPPPDVNFIVIDNISHHLRYKFSKGADIDENLRNINYFYNNHLLPLIFRGIRENLRLILIHEVSSDINTGEDRPFFHKLYDRLDAFKINLLKDSRQNLTEIILDQEQQVFSYEIMESGFVWT